jgi:putative cell wall-binding protein
MKKRVLSIFLNLVMIIMMFPGTAGAVTANDVPKNISAPANVSVFQDQGFSEFVIGYSAPDDVRKLAQMFDSGEVEQLGYSGFNANRQIDYKYNESGSWHYDPSWDTLGNAPNIYEYGADVSSPTDEARIKYTDMEPTDIDSGLDNNTVYFRVRYVLDYYDENTGEEITLISPWSETAPIGKTSSGSKVTSIEAPTLVKAELKKYDDGRPYFEITAKIPESVKALNNGAGSISQLTSVKKSGGDWSGELGTSAGILQDVFTVDPEDIGGLGQVNIEAASYDIRVRFGYSSVFGGNSEVYSPYSNVVTIGTPAYGRLSGQSRIETAIAVAQEGWPNGANAVILTRDDNYPDALTGTPLSKKLDAPILFSNTQTLTPATGTEIARLKPAKVVILGGTGAVSQTIENQLRQSYTVQRIGGADRYETAAKIAAELGFKGKVVIATGEDFHDALVAAPLAAYKGIPMLLTTKDSLPSATAKALDVIAASETIVAGKSDDVSDGVLNRLTNAKRYCGGDYYETATVLADKFGADLSKIFFATSKDFPDALSGSALAAKFNNPILFVNDPVSNSVKDFLAKNSSLTKGYRLLGGEGAIPSSVVNQIDQYYQ